MIPARTTGSALQRAVRDAVLEAVGSDSAPRVAHTHVAVGWGGVLFVDLYARPGASSLEGHEDALRTSISVLTGHQPDRIAVRWRIGA